MTKFYLQIDKMYACTKGHFKTYTLAKPRKCKELIGNLVKNRF